MSHGNDELVLTQHAIDTIAGAYEQAAGELRDVADNFSQIYSLKPWGTLPSILQLQERYRDLALGDDNSAVSRIREFAQVADEFATWVRSSGASLFNSDQGTAVELTDSLQN